jgi:hypothetical protein
VRLKSHAGGFYTLPSSEGRILSSSAHFGETNSISQTLLRSNHLQFATAGNFCYTSSAFRQGCFRGLSAKLELNVRNCSAGKIWVQTASPPPAFLTIASDFLRQQRQTPPRSHPRIMARLEVQSWD